MKPEKILLACVCALHSLFCIAGEAQGICEVQFDPVGGVCSVTSMTAKVQEELVLPKPSRMGYSHDGWYTSDGDLAGMAGEKYLVESNVVLYAKWDFLDGGESIHAVKDSSTGLTWYYYIVSDYGPGSDDQAIICKVSPDQSGRLVFPDVLEEKSVGRHFNVVGIRGGCKYSYGIDRELYRSGWTNVSSVTFPIGIKVLGEDALRGCRRLTAVTIPETVTVLEAGAFSETGLTDVTIPETVERSDLYAFCWCESLWRLHYPAVVQHIESRFSHTDQAGLYGCPLLRDLVLPKCMVEDIGGISSIDLSELPSVVEIAIPSGIVYVSVYNCSNLKKIVFPESVRYISEDSFSNCDSLDEVVFLGDVPVSDDGDGEEYAYYVKLFSKSTGIYFSEAYAEKWKKFLRGLGYGGKYGVWQGLDTRVCFGPLVPGEKVSIETGLVGYSAKGLPSGLKYDAKTGLVSGVATKPTGDAGMAVVFMKQGAEMVTRIFVVGALPVLTTAVIGGKGCKANGGGTYLANKKVSLRATAAVGCAFLGWFCDAESRHALAGDYQNASFSYVMPPTNVTLFAKFVSAGDPEYDELSISLGAETIILTAGVPVSLPVAVVSATKYSVSAKNLPGGLKLVCNNSDGTFTVSGTPTSPDAGTKMVELTVKNTLNKKGVTARVKIVVDQGRGLDGTGKVLNGITIRAARDVDPDWNGDVLRCYAGVQQKISLQLFGLEGADTLLKVKNLPAGLKLLKTAVDPKDKEKTYAYSIEGVPTAVGIKEVEIYASNKYKWTGSQKITVQVEALPQGALDAFDGYMKIVDVMHGGTNVLVVGTATMTVGKTGKISGKMVGSDGKSYSFSANGYSGADLDRGLFLVTASLTYGKTLIPFDLLVRLEDHTSWQYGGSESARIPCSVARTMDRTDDRIVLAELRQKILGSGGKVTTDYGSIENLLPGVKLYYPLTYKQIQPQYFQAPAMTLSHVITAENDAALASGDYLDLKIAENATVKISGKIGGRAVSASSVLQTRTLTAFADDWIGQKVRDVSFLSSTSATGTLSAHYEDWVVGTYIVIPTKGAFPAYAAYVEFAYDAQLTLTVKMTLNAKIKGGKLAGAGSLTGELTKVEYLSPKSAQDVTGVRVGDF